MEQNNRYYAYSDRGGTSLSANEIRVLRSATRIIGRLQDNLGDRPQYEQLWHEYNHIGEHVDRVILRHLGACIEPS